MILDIIWWGIMASELAFGIGCAAYLFNRIFLNYDIAKDAQLEEK